MQDLDELRIDLGTLSPRERQILETIVGASRRRQHQAPRFQGPADEQFIALTAQPYRLTARELEILKLLFEGQTNKEVASALAISPRTVELHRGRVYQKLGVRNAIEMTRFVMSFSDTERR